MIDSLYPNLGIIIPTFFPKSASEQNIQELFALTMHQLEYYVAPEHVEIVIDGDQRSQALIEAHRASHGSRGFGLTVLPANVGKLGAIHAGLRHQYERFPNLEMFIIRDCDGDHTPDAIPSFMRIAAELESEHEQNSFMITGARTSRHHPMGWMRGELETVLDAVTMDALAYALAQESRAIDLTSCSPGRIVPDISSGYKLYSRKLVQDVFVPDPSPGCLSLEDYLHLAPETGPFVEAMLLGARLGEIERTTTNEQPTTSFGEFGHAHLYGSLLAWTWTRLNVPTSVGVQMYDNHVSKSLLSTMSGGTRAVDQVRELAIGLTNSSKHDHFPKRRRRSFV